jgi:hypothetical protein
MVARRYATCCWKARRPLRESAILVRGFLPTKSLVISMYPAFSSAVRCVGRTQDRLEPPEIQRLTGVQGVEGRGQLQSGRLVNQFIRPVHQIFLSQSPPPISVPPPQAAIHR